MTTDWVSEETEAKEEDFRGLVRMHLLMAKSAMVSHRSPKPYLYMDLYAGPGELEFDGRRFAGSPMVFLEEAQRAGIAHQALFSERDLTRAELLRPHVKGHELIVGDCQSAIPDWLARRRPDRAQFGLCYADPIGTRIPVELLALVASYFPKMEILSYVAANDAYKRPAGAARKRDPQWAGPTLAGDIAAVGKPYKLIRVPRTDHQWTFVLWTGWGGFPEWKRSGFHRLETPTGRDVLALMNMTGEQYRAAMCPQLDLWGDAS